MRTLTNLVLFSILLSGCAGNMKKEVSALDLENSRLSNAVSLNESKIRKLNSEIDSKRKNITTLNREISSARRGIEKSRQELSESDAYFGSSEGQTVYVRNSCRTPEKGYKPKPFCETRSEAKEFALSYCSMSVGCEVALRTAGDELDTFSKRFLASEACSRSVSELNNAGYSADQTVVNAFDAMSASACNNQGEGIFAFFGKVVGCMTSASIQLAKVAKYTGCTDRQAKICYENQTDWNSAPTRRRKTCESHVANAKLQKKSIDGLQRNVNRFRSSVGTKKQEIKSAEAQIKRLRSAVASDNEKIADNNARLASIKDTMRWKISGGN